MGLNNIDAPLACLSQAGATPVLEEALRQSGLLRFEDQLGRFGFLHLTFHEYYLARSWLAKDLLDAMHSLWADPHHEETLGLLLALREEVKGSATVEATLREFAQYWRKRHRVDRLTLYRAGRSPFRIMLRAAARGGIRLNDPLLGAGSAWFAMRRAIASAPGMPAATLAALAADPHRDVRLAVAKNTEAPAATLAALATDRDMGVRVAVAMNGVTGTVNQNSATPAATLAALAADPDRGVRLHVAVNRATPAATLAALAADPSWDVRLFVTWNSATPAATLAAIAAYGSYPMREEVISNPGMLLEELWSAPGSLTRMARGIPGVRMLSRYRAMRRFVRMTTISSVR